MSAAVPITTKWFDDRETIALVQGESRTVTLTITDPDGNAQDLTSATIYFTVQKDVGDRTPLLRKTSADPTQILVATPRSGVATIYILPADTRLLQPGDYVFDVWVSYTSSLRYPVILPGTFRVAPTITQVP